MVRAVITEIYQKSRPGTTKLEGKAKLVGSGDIIEWVSQEHRPTKAGSRFGLKVGMRVAGTKRRGGGFYELQVPRDSTSPGQH